MPTLGEPEPRLILLVDDDDDIREVAAVALELVSGFRVLTATNGLDAFEQARQHQPDGILLDVMMPVMDGMQTVRKLQTDPLTASIPVILLTARVDGDQPDGSVVGVLPKPFDPMRLGSDVSRLMGWS